MGKEARTPACPKCGNTNLVFHEMWNQASISFDMRNGKIDPEGVMNWPDYPEKVIAECLICQHGWTLKGVESVKELATWPEDRDSAGWP